MSSGIASPPSPVRPPRGPGADHPRVLIVCRSKIDAYSSTGASRGKWFAEWPRESLAQLYSSKSPAETGFDTESYEFGRQDRLFGRCFSWLKNSPLAVAIKPGAVPSSTIPAGGTRPPAKSRLLPLSNLLIHSGLWEVCFPPRLSPALIRWVQSFRPDALYVACTDLSYMRLALLLNERMGIPFCLQIDDDWPHTLYESSPFARLMRHLVRSTFIRMVERASICLSNGDPMSAAYQTRYGRHFEPVMLCDDSGRFARTRPERLTDAGTISIVYSGALSHLRWEALRDLSEAGAALGERGIKVRIFAFSYLIPADAAAGLHGLTNVEIREGLSDRDVPAILKGADILFLPESFDLSLRNYLRYSISSKAHLYMMSQRPILVYGPPGIGVVEYARTAGWARLVDQRDRGALTTAIEELTRNSAQSDALMKRGWEVARENHEAGRVREKFRRALEQTAWPDGRNRHTGRS